MANKKIIFPVIIATAALVVLGLFYAASWFWRGPGVTSKIYHIGLLQMSSSIDPAMSGFKDGMAGIGFKEGGNVTYEYYNAEGDMEKLKDYANRLLANNPDLIFTNTSPPTQIIKDMTAQSNIPVVFSVVADPLGAGFVKSIQSSGNNLAGVSCAYVDIAPKRLEILKSLAPQVKKVLVFYRPQDKSGAPATKELIRVAPDLGVEIVSVPIEKKEDIKNYLDKLVPGQIDAMMDPADSMVTSGLVEWGVSKAKELKIPLMMLSQGECEAGALACYGADYYDLGKQSSLIAGQIFRGVSPSDIPVEMPRRYFFTLNLQTVQAIGLSIPASLPGQADLIIK